MSLKLPPAFSFLKSVGWFEDKKAYSAAKRERSPTLKLQTDKEVYRPGDSVIVTIEICSPATLKDGVGPQELSEDIPSFLVDGLSFELKGIEKSDSQWFSIQKPLPGSKQRGGEHLFLDCSAPSILSKVIIASGQSKTYIVRAELPKILPPSYRGISIRYIYYVRSAVFGRWLALDNGHQNKVPANSMIQLETRAPLQIWVSQKSNNLLNEGSLQLPIDQLSIYWREKDEDSEWTRANDNIDALEEGYDSSRDDVSSVCSYNPAKGNADLRNSLSMQSLSSRLSISETPYSQGERPSFPLYSPLPQLSVSEIVDDPNGGLVSPQGKLNHSLSNHSSNDPRLSLDLSHLKDDVGPPVTPKHVESAVSEGFMRGKSYNIRIDNQILLRFSPKNSDSIYYFGDMIGGTLTFFHGNGIRRCLEVSVTLETSETINPHIIHPSRRGSPTITKVHSEHHEVVADLHQTSFLFSIPIDGPMSFSTSKVSVQWSLRFEFLTTPEGLDPTRYEHPLLVEKREKGDWTLPITVYAPPLRRQAAQASNEKSLSLGIF